MSIFHRHRWTDWAVTDRGKMCAYGAIRGWYMVQERHCLTCGKTQRDEQVRSDITASFCARLSDMPQRAPRKDGVVA